ncbi:CU044_5270 family protein [Streptomyces sp. NPDC057682]|uniref:CU044_5270 family protein n=1 Tax=Streptomyces sp. NPDC057682 TaxID=3346210 RepID=UPI0036A94A02
MNTPTGFTQRLGAELARLEEERAGHAAEERLGQERNGRNGAPVTARRRGLARPGVRRTLLVGLAAGAVAATVVATSDGPGATPRPPRPMTVAQVLDAAATAAAKEPERKPGPHQWVYTDQVVCTKGCEHSLSWQRYDGASNARYGPATSTGEPSVLVSDAPRSTRPSKIGDRPRETREALSRLPADPRKLLARISTDRFYALEADPYAAIVHSIGHQSLPELPDATTPGSQFARILFILQNEPGIPPRTTAALYRALALVPGVRLVDTPARDAAGRPGLTLAFDRQDSLPGPVRLFLFLDPDTYAYLGSRTERPGRNAVALSSARVASGIVDHPGQVPGGPAPDPSRITREE